MHRFIFIALVSLVCLIVTWRGRKFSGGALAVALVTDFLTVLTMMDDHKNVSEFWQIAMMWAMAAGLFGQIFMSIWYSTVPPTCPKCGNVGHFNRPEST